MLLIPKPQQRTPVQELPELKAGLTLEFCLSFARRQFWVFLISLLLAGSIGAFYLTITRSIYTASATLMIDLTKSQLFQQRSVLGDAPTDTAWVDSQISTIGLERPKVAFAVAKNLALANERELFEPASNWQSWVTSVSIDWQSLITSVWTLLKRRNSLDEHKSTPPPSETISEADQTEQAAAVVASRLDVRRLGFTYLVAINYSSRDPDQAVRIANAVATAYIIAEKDAKYKAIRLASDWLQERYQTLRAQASEAERAAVEFRSNHALVSTGGRLLGDQQLTELNTRVGAARARTLEAQSRLSRVEAVIKAQAETGDLAYIAVLNKQADPTVADTLFNPIITRLRGQYLDLINKEADWTARFGRDHKAVIVLRNQLKDMRNSMFDELKRIAETYRSDYEIAKKIQQQAEDQLTEIVAKIPDNEQITLRGLESAAQSYRSYFENFFQHYNEAVQQQSAPVNETLRLVAPASGASKTFPATNQVISLTVLAGIGLGVGVGLWREARDRGFRTAAQVRALLVTDCIALVPKVTKGPIISLGHHHKAVSNAARTFRLIPQPPRSRYANSIRAIRLAADLRTEKDSTKVIGITSCLPGEGKSTVATMLAHVTAAGGRRVILVDCDLRNPAISRKLAPGATSGLLEVILRRIPLNNAIWTDPATNMAFLPAGSGAELGYTDEILASDPMKYLFDELRQQYEYVIVDLSPLAPVVDARAASHVIDGYVLLVEWGRTKVNVVQGALEEAHDLYERVLGVVLNRVDMRSISRFDSDRARHYLNEDFVRYGYTD